jgi:hypothetical protein
VAHLGVGRLAAIGQGVEITTRVRTMDGTSGSNPTHLLVAVPVVAVPGMVVEVVLPLEVDLPLEAKAALGMEVDLPLEAQAALGTVVVLLVLVVEVLPPAAQEALEAVQHGFLVLAAQAGHPRLRKRIQSRS